MLLDQKDWSCAKKREARRATLIDPYKELTGRASLPRNQDYWTICGQCATSEGEPLPGCELDQLCEVNFISSRQFHGVEINEDIHSLNQKAYPETNWHLGDFYEVMVAQTVFRPGFINIDLPRTVDMGVGYVGKVLAYLTHLPGEMMAVANLIIRLRHYAKRDCQEVISLFEKNPRVQFACRRGWIIRPKLYVYPGTGQSARSLMGSLVFWKSATCRRHEQSLG